ncbi:MAG: hypothetical protein JETT_0074 [Candidatus Jettenia ecosi]|uniref:Uncharacterized protein n=1 Tax=Candidatus Jettenia ecosi TaxID=2494326 RepID=A0A533QFW9_9BACT|nr:MAG: hypothetical protein JETT_0074 [Candidatus Jettenia ecosi]
MLSFEIILCYSMVRIEVRVRMSSEGRRNIVKYANISVQIT